MEKQKFKCLEDHKLGFGTASLILFNIMIYGLRSDDNYDIINTSNLSGCVLMLHG